jgi:hypothetical protein
MSRSHQNIWSGKRFQVAYEPVHSHDPANLVLLSREFQNQDDSRYTDLKMLTIRHAWMRQQEEVHGKRELTCYICGKKHLNPWSKSKKRLATLDHVEPIAKSPHRWNDPTNFQVACFMCNSVKRDT